MTKKTLTVNIANHDCIVFGDIHIEDNKIKKNNIKSKKEDKCKNNCLPGFIDQHTHAGYGISFDKVSDNMSNEIIV